MNVDPGLQLDLIGALQRRLGMLVAVVGASLLAAYWVAMALPNYYASSATLFVEPQAINQRLVESGVAPYDIAYRLSLMSAQILSRPRLSRVIDELGLFEEESATMLREEVINLMRSRITVVPVNTALPNQAKRRDEPDLNTFMVTFTHKSPRMAADVAQRLANDFVKEHIEERVGMTRKSLEFIEAELTRLTTEHRAVQDQITKLKNDNPGRLPDDLLSNQRILDRTLSELREGHRMLDMARSNKSFWDTQVLSASALSDPRDDASPVRRLQLLELQLAEYRARGFTDRHPDVIRAEQEITEVRAQVESLEDEDGEARTPTVAQQNAEAQRERAALEMEMAAKEVERIRASADLVEQRIVETPKVAEVLDQLEQQSRQLAENAKVFAQRELQARVQVNVERRQLGEQFRILEAAFPAPTPSSPNRLLIIVMGLIVGLALGVGFAVLAEATDSSFRVVRDVQATLALPVLAAIPDIILESDRVSIRRRVVRNAIAASVVVVFSLAGGAVTYWYVNGLPGWLSGAVERSEETAPAPSEAVAEPAARLPRPGRES
jgi:polysaccharide chain length determinant protein (PEP-CTERM system associated)